MAREKSFSQVLAEAAERDGYKAYANMAIPVYVIIDRERDLVRVFSEPECGTYTVEAVSPFGKPFTIPAPVSITVDTVAYPRVSDPAPGS